MILVLGSIVCVMNKKEEKSRHGKIDWKIAEPENADVWVNMFSVFFICCAVVSRPSLHNYCINF